MEEAFFQTLALGARLHAEGRALPFGHRLPERDPPARLGLPGRAARLQGVPRRPAQRRGVQAKLGGADGFPGRARRRGGRGGAFPATDRTGTAPVLGALFAHVGGDLGAGRGARGCPTFASSRRIARSRMRTRWAARRRRPSAARGRLWIADFVFKWRDSSCRASTSGARNRAR